MAARRPLVDIAGAISELPSGDTLVGGLSKFSTTITSDGSTVAYAVTHNLGVTDIIAQAYDSSGNRVEVEVARTSANVTTIGFGVAPPNTTTFRVTVVG